MTLRGECLRPVASVHVRLVGAHQRVHVEHCLGRLDVQSHRFPAGGVDGALLLTDGNGDLKVKLNLPNHVIAAQMDGASLAVENLIATYAHAEIGALEAIDAAFAALPEC